MKEKSDKKHYNIMTSCDDALMPYISVQLVSLSGALSDAIIDFYLFHRAAPKSVLAPLRSVCSALKNVRFHAVQVREAEKYDAISAHGGRWGGEAYYSLCAYQYLPQSEDRVLYIDAGDILITGDISPFYNTDFEGKLLIVQPAKYHTFFRRLDGGGGIYYHLPYEEADLETCFKEICETPNLFNSGSYVINLARMRDEELTMDDYVAFSEELCAMSGKEDGRDVYWGDQGFMSAAFLGDLKFIEPPDGVNINYRPYNFGMFYYRFHHEDPNYYTPVVIHYCGGGNCPKPWDVKFDNPVKRFASDVGKEVGNPAMKAWYDLWNQKAHYTDQLLNRLGYQASSD